MTPERNAHKRTALALVRPAGVWSVRDGRNFAAGEPGIGRNTPVNPSTFCGALTTALRIHYGRSAHPYQVAGPFLVSQQPDIGGGTLTRALVPTPADLVTDKDQPGRRKRLRWAFNVNRDEVMWDLDAGRHPIAGPTGHGEHESSWETPELMASYLSGTYTEDVPNTTTPIVDGIRTQVQPGVAGMLARHQVSRFNNAGIGQTYYFGALVTLETEMPAGTTMVPFGGEGREAEVTFVDVPRGLLPSEPDSFPHGTLTLVTVTPSLFPRHGWTPPLPQNASIIGAAVLGPRTVRTGTPGRWRLMATVGPGSVYVIRFAGEPETAQSAASNFAKSITDPQRLRGRCVKQHLTDLRSAGYGMCLIGRI